jgi:hypothetical protein
MNVVLFAAEPFLPKEICKKMANVHVIPNIFRRM